MAHNLLKYANNPKKSGVMNYFWSLLFLALSLQAAYNPFFRESPKVKKVPEPVAKPMPLPPLLKPAFDPLPAPKAFSASVLTYYGYLETEKGKFALLQIGENAIVLKEGDPFYANSTKYFVRNITSNYLTIDDSGKTQTIYFTTGGQ